MNNKIFFLLLISALKVYGCELPKEAYEIKVQQILESILKLKQGMPSNFQEYCQEKIEDIQKVKNNNGYLDLAVWKIEEDWVCFYVQTHNIYSQSQVQLMRQFAKASQDLLASRVRKALGCYVNFNLLEHFERNYSKPLTQVDNYEFSKKLSATFSKKQIQLLHLEESAHLASLLLQRGSFIARYKL